MARDKVMLHKYITEHAFVVSIIFAYWSTLLLVFCIGIYFLPNWSTFMSVLFMMAIHSIFD